MIIREFEVGEGGGGRSDLFSTPTRRYIMSRKEIIVDDFDREALRRKIYMQFL